MATVRPRIQFVPSERTRALLEQMAGLSGQSMASVASEILDEAAPVIQGQIDALLKIAGRPDEARKYLEDYAAKATTDIAQVMMDFSASEDARTVEGQKARRRSARAARNP